MIPNAAREDRPSAVMHPADPALRKVKHGASLSYIVRQTELYSKTLSQKLRGGRRRKLRKANLSDRSKTTTKPTLQE